MTVQIPTFAFTEQFESVPRKAIDALQFEGANGIAAGDPTKFITLIPAAQLILNTGYATELERRGIDTAAETSILNRFTIHNWNGAAFAPGAAIGVAPAADSGGWGLATLTLDFTGANGIRLAFGSDKTRNAFFWWRVTMRLINTTFPILP